MIDALALALDFLALVRKAGADPFLSPSHADLAPGRQITWVVRAQSRALIFWNSLYVQREYATRAREGDRFLVSLNVSCPLSGSVTARRGVWESRTARLGLRDPLRLFSAWIDFPYPDSFSVHGPDLPFRARRNVGKAGYAESGTQSTRREDELWDSRKYAPGDDARKINWKQYGHSGDLFTRIGDHLPPPMSQVWVMFDPRVPASEGKTREQAIEALEYLLQKAQNCCLELFRRGAALSLQTPGSDPILVSANVDEAGPGEARVLDFFTQIEIGQGTPLGSARRYPASEDWLVFSFPSDSCAEMLLSLSKNAAPGASTLIFPKLRENQPMEKLRGAIFDLEPKWPRPKSSAALVWAQEANLVSASGQKSVEAIDV